MEKYTTAGHVIRNYRQRAKNSGYNVEAYSDEEILRLLGDDLRQQGRSPDEIGETYGTDFQDRYYDQINAPERGREGILGGIKEFGAGFSRGADGVMSSVTALGGLAADAAGFEGISDNLMEKSAKYRAEAALGGPSIERATDVRWDNMDEVARFLAGGLGEATPSVIEAGASFAVGGGGGYLIAKQLAKKRLKQVIKNADRDNLDEIFKRAIAVDEAGRTGKRVGSNIALSGSSFGMNTGEIYSELHSYSQLDKNDPNYIPESEAKSLSITHGMLAGGLDYASAGAILNKALGIGDKLAASYLKRVVQGLPAGVFVEGATEAAQQFIAMAAEKYAHGNEEPFTQDEINQMVDAGVLGMLGGAQFTAMGAIKGPKKDSSDVGVDSDEVEGNQEKLSPEGIDKRIETLNERLRIEDTSLEVGMEVEQFLGVSGKVSAIRADGMVEIQTEEGSEPIIVREDTLSEKLTDLSELEAIIDEVEAPASKGNKSAQMEEQIANEKIDKQTEVKQPPVKPTPSGEPVQTYIFRKDGKEVGGLTKQELEDTEEVYDKLKELAESGAFRKSNSNHRRVLTQAGMSEETFRKFKNPKVRDHLYNAGITNENGIWLLGTKQDADIVNTKQQEDKNKREDWIVNKLKITIGGTVVGRDGKEANVVGFTEDNRVLLEGGVIGVEPKTLRLPKKKKVKREPVVVKPTEQDYMEAEGEVVIERQAEEQEAVGLDEKLAAEAETERLIEVRAFEKLKERQKEESLKKAEEADESKSNEAIIKEVSVRTEEKPKPKKLPAGSLPNNFVGDFDITEGVAESLGDDGSLMGNWDGLSDRDKSSTKAVTRKNKKEEVKTPGNRVLVVVEKINNDHDDVESGQVRVLSAKKGKMDGREVLRIYDSLRVGAKGKSPGWRTLYGKGQQGTVDSTPLEGYRLVGKITTQRDAVEYGASKMDALFGNLDELKNHPAFKTSMAMSSNRKWFGLFRDAEKASQFLDGDGQQILENYKKSLGDKVGTEFLNADGKAIDLSGERAPSYISSKEALEYFMTKAGDNSTALEAYVQAYQAYATTGMDEVVDYLASKEKVYDKTFKFDGKEYSIQEVLNRARGVEGYTPIDSDQPFDTPLVKAALNAASKLEVPSPQSGGGTFFDAGKTAGEIEKQLQDESDENLNAESSERRTGGIELDESSEKGFQGSRDTEVDSTQNLDITGSGGLTGGEQFHKIFSHKNPLSIALLSVRNGLRDKIINFAKIDLSQTSDAAQRLGLDSDSSKGQVLAAYNNDVDFLLSEIYAELVQKEMVPPYFTRPGDKRINEKTLLANRINNSSYNMRSNFIKNIKSLEEVLTAKDRGRKLTGSPVPVVRAKIRNRLEISNVNRARDSGIGVTAYLHREFGLDLQDALQHGGFDQDEVLSILEKLDSEKAFKEPRNGGRKYQVSDAIYKDKSNGARVKSDGSPYTNGFLETAGAKNLLKYIDETFARIQETVISKDDADKWQAATKFIKEAWIPLSYEMEIDSSETQEVSIDFDDDTKETQKAQILKESEESSKRLTRIQKTLSNLRTDGRRHPSQKKLEGKPLEREIRKAQSALKSEQEKKAKVDDKLIQLERVKAGSPKFIGPMEGKEKQYDTVVEDGMLLSELAQSMAEFFGFTDEINFLNDEHYNALADHTSVEVITQDVVSTLDKRIRHTAFISPATGKAEPSMPIVVDAETASHADKVARSKTSIAVRSPENPLEKMGMDKQLADNRLAISEFLDGGQTDQPFSLIAGMDRLLDIVESSADFREGKQIAFLARKLKASKLAQGVQIRFVPWEVYSKVASVNEYGYSAAQYMPAKNEIWVSDVFGDGKGSSMENLVSAIVHEGIHVPTKQFLDVGYAYFTNNPLAKELLDDSSMGEEFGKIYGQVHETLLPMLRKLGGADMIYGLSSADEFFSELGSDYQLRNFLRGVKLSNEDRKALGIQGKSAIRTAWDYVVNLLAKLLGISDKVKQEPELLKYTEDMLNKVVDMADNLAVMGRGINDVNVRGISSLDIFAGPNRQMVDKTMEKSSEFTWIDGTQRKHIFDKDAKIISEVKNGMKLDELIEHPALFEAYPALREIQIRKVDYGPALGSFEGYWNQKDNKWMAGPTRDSRSKPTITLYENQKNKLSTLIHEIQHAVDAIEGFSKGSNSETARKIMSIVVDALAGSREKFKGIEVAGFITKLDKMAERARQTMEGETDKMSGYQAFLLYRTLTTFQTALTNIAGSIEMDGYYTPDKLVAEADVETESGEHYGLSEILYYWNFGEITARTQEKLLGSEVGKITGLSPDGEIRETPQGPLASMREEGISGLEDKIADKMNPGTSWTLPDGDWLAEYTKGAKDANESAFLGNIRLASTIFQNSNSESALPSNTNKRSIPRPDESARVYHEASAGGLNELVIGLGQAFKSVRDVLPSGMNMEAFIDKYGKLSLGMGSKSVTTAMKVIANNLKPFDINANDVRVTDAGRNRTAKHYGIRYAIAYIEKTRELARKNVGELVTSLDNSRVEVAEKRSILKALEKRQLESVETLATAVRNKIINRTDASLEQLEKIVKFLPEEELTQADLKELNKLSIKEVGDAMVALLQQPGTIEERTAEEINSVVQTGLIPGLSAFQGSDKQTSLRRAIFVNAVKNSGDIMSLLRLSTNKLGIEQRDFINAGEAVLKATTKKQVEAIANGFSKRVGTHLKRIKESKIRILELEESVKGIEKDVKVNQAINDTLKFRSDKFRWTMGELEDFDIRDGSKIRVMLKNEKGEYDNKSYQVYEVKFKNGDLEDRKGFIKANRETLEWIRKHGSKYENEPWLDIMREQAELALQLPVTQQWTAVRRAAWMAGLESLNQRFSRLGYEGKRLAQMTSRTVALYRDIISQSMKYSKEFNRAYDNVLKATGETGTSFYTGMYQDIFSWFDNHPEYGGNEELAFSEMWKHIRKTSNVKDKSRLNEESRRAVRTMVQKTIQARDWEAKVNRDLGNRVKDEEVKVQSYVDGDAKNVDFYRMPLDMGYATLPRSINDAKVNSLMEYMKEKGWSGKMQDMKSTELITALHQSGEIEEMASEIEELFDEEIVSRFLNPFMNGLNRKSLFYGPADKDGWGQEMSNAYISEVWRKSNGSILSFMNAIYDSSVEGEFADEQKRGDWYMSMYKQIHKRYREVNRVHRDLISRKESETRETQALKHVPRSLDARQVESRLPKDFFLYDMYDEVSTPIRMAMFSAAAVFGRDGSKATEAFRGSRRELAKSFDKFATVISAVTGVAPEKPSGSYSRSVRKAAYAELKNMGSKKPREEFQKLYNDSVAYGEMQTTFNHLKDYYGTNNDAGPFKDARFLLELLGTQSLSVLNNPKSSFWQGMSMFEFPLAFRGANKMAAKGTAKTLANFVNQTFGGVAEAMGVQLDRVGRYASSLNSTHYRMEEMELGLRDYLTQIGRGGEMQDPKNMKRYLRMIKGIATHHKKRGTRAPVDLMTAVTGIFPYVNNVVNHSVGVGAAYVYQDLVLKVAKHIKDNGLTTFQEITADDLGMGKSSFEWIVGEKDGFDNANNMLVDSGAPSISRMAFDYVDRLQTNPKAPVMSHEQILMVNQMAMNNMSGEGFNSKPAWLYTNPMMKYFAFFLGWPLGKMARDNKFIFRGDKDSVNSYAAFLKYIGLMSAIYLPVGLSFAFMIDWYDEEVLDKPNSLPPLTPWAMLPVIGPAIAASDEQFTMYALTSRMAKAGTPYGMGFDVMNSIMAKGDTYGGTKEFSLDSRIFAFSIFKNFYDSMGNWMHQGEFDWGNVGRPLTYAFGGNSVLQAFDATNTLFDLDNFESRVSEYIGVRNYVKKTAFLMGMPMRSPGGAGSFSRPSPVSVNIKQMERAAYAGDEKDFNKQYGEAIEAAREYLLDNPRVGMTPEKYVLQKFKARSLRAGVTRSKIQDEDWGALLDILPEDARAKIKRYEANHEYFMLGMEGSSSKETFSPEDMRRKILLGY